MACVRIRGLVVVLNLEKTLEKNPSSVSAMMSPKKRIAVIMGSTLGSIFGLLLLCTTIYVLVKKYSKKVEEDYLDHILSGLPTRFSYEELKVITQNFNIKLGEGGYGSQPEEDMHLVSVFKRKAEEGQLEDLVDKLSDEMQSNASEVVETMKVAACCLQSEIKRRPSMSTLVKVLDDSMNIEDCLSFDFSNLPDPEVVATDSLTLASSLSGPR
ncbi:Concanavalin A-like lectin/glucanase, subgroup [Corchorus olitorius]|uniref:Concanavalin A-like lectin/glucanase, subgroup n=1 Tax=Corchorus olitorius TaxID=93759 RepID=A0A1R3GSD4_9ROSI|nr:Concanavalin A-like lectin/glucanase, subgroup [Corchorus olitorius]